jgi:Protein of unknown function (DUF3455)
MMHLSATAICAVVPSLAAVTMMVLATPALGRVPDAIAAPDQVPIVTVHGEGAQIYECKADAGGRLVWQFREPIATLLLNDKTVGRHSAGPTWAFYDGSAITGRTTASAPGATPRDIPWLRLDVTAHSGTGELSAATTVQRINTKGGAMAGSCGRPGAFLSVPYSADYVFLRGS